MQKAIMNLMSLCSTLGWFERCYIELVVTRFGHSAKYSCDGYVACFSYSVDIAHTRVPAPTAADANLTRELTVVEGAQVGLMWRVARQV